MQFDERFRSIFEGIFGAVSHCWRARLKIAPITTGGEAISDTKEALQ